MSGLGIRQAVPHSFAAFIAASSAALSTNSTAALAPPDSATHKAILIFNNFVPPMAQLDLQSIPTDQRKLSSLIDEAAFNNVINTSSSPARVRSSASQESSAWLNSPPLRFNNLIMSNAEFKIAIAIRFGIPIFPDNAKCKSCTKHLSTYHALTCKVERSGTPRHNSVRDAFIRILYSCRMGPKSEDNTILSSHNIRADISFSYLGKPTVADVAIIHPEQALYTKNADVVDGFAADNYEEKIKMKKYKDACAFNGVGFVPLVYEVYGCRGKNSDSFIKHVAKLSSSLVSDGDYDACLFNLYAQIAVTLQRGNALCILKHFHESPSLIPGIVLNY
jgi:hypothetical protein